jgi:hypothetical protein
MLKNHLRTAFRNLLKNKPHAFINIAGLSIGMAVALLISLWIYDEVSFDRNFEHSGRIAKVIQNVTNNGEVQTWTTLPYPLAEELRKNYGSDFKRVVLATGMVNHLIGYGDKKLNLTGSFFESGVTDLLSVKMLRGDGGSLNDPSSLLISESAAKACFGNEDPIDKLLKIDNTLIVDVRNHRAVCAAAGLYQFHEPEHGQKRNAGKRSRDPQNPRFHAQTTRVAVFQ